MLALVPRFQSSMVSTLYLKFPVHPLNCNVPLTWIGDTVVEVMTGVNKPLVPALISSRNTFVFDICLFFVRASNLNHESSMAIHNWKMAEVNFVMGFSPSLDRVTYVTRSDKQSPLDITVIKGSEYIRRPVQNLSKLVFVVNRKLPLVKKCFFQVVHFMICICSSRLLIES